MTADPGEFFEVAVVEERVKDTVTVCPSILRVIVLPLFTIFQPTVERDNRVRLKPATPLCYMSTCDHGVVCTARTSHV